MEKKGLGPKKLIFSFLGQKFQKIKVQRGILNVITRFAKGNNLQFTRKDGSDSENSIG